MISRTDSKYKNYPDLNLQGFERELNLLSLNRDDASPFTSLPKKWAVLDVATCGSHVS